MCFSTTASFGAGVILSGAGILAATKVTEPKQRMFAAIPAIFAIQQFAEGFVWLSLTQEPFADWLRRAAFVFLFFAEVLWPLWIPMAILRLENNSQRKKILRFLAGLGLVFALHTFYYLLTNAFEAQIAEYHIQYKLHYPPTFVLFTWGVYGILTILPTFISSVPKMWIVGLPMMASFFIAEMLYPNYVISVWCYFAAIISIIVVIQQMEMSKRLKFWQQ
ncbi:MAG: DUF6629 family protein [Haliscomenobacter sp.]|uniref:DUF6629 family protein n=1 Tax=Haliscomenobacter sp. TaxID=2717303 RepID=UPI0029A14EB0|nr:DUF6629 family protein [Haliscomenobacter sp.]MDX2071230.1 DUF6629 family protein [Haliscomenobacter sp.]